MRCDCLALHAASHGQQQPAQGCIFALDLCKLLLQVADRLIFAVDLFLQLFHAHLLALARLLCRDPVAQQAAQRSLRWAEITVPKAVPVLADKSSMPHAVSTSNQRKVCDPAYFKKHESVMMYPCCAFVQTFAKLAPEMHTRHHVAAAKAPIGDFTQHRSISIHAATESFWQAAPLDALDLFAVCGRLQLLVQRVLALIAIFLIRVLCAVTLAVLHAMPCLHGLRNLCKTHLRSSGGLCRIGCRWRLCMHMWLLVWRRRKGNERLLLLVWRLALGCIAVMLPIWDVPCMSCVHGACYAAREGARACRPAGL